MIALNKYDIKQIRLIDKKISLFTENKIDLYKFVCDLIGLLNTLESVSESWKDDFRTEINTLEMIYDNTVDGSISKRKDNPKEVIHESISIMRKLIRLLMEGYLVSPDLFISKEAVMLDANWLMCPVCNEVWESPSEEAMVICPKCDQALHNPRYRKKG